MAGGCEVSTSLRLRATAIGAGERFSSATTASPPPSATAYTVWTASPPGTRMAVSTTGTPLTNRCRHVTSRDGVCHRSSAATHQSRSTEPSMATNAPLGVTRARQVPPTTPIVWPVAGPVTVAF